MADRCKWLTDLLPHVTALARESGRELRAKAYFAFMISQIGGLLANTTTVFVGVTRRVPLAPVTSARLLTSGARFRVGSRS